MAAPVACRKTTAPPSTLIDWPVMALDWSEQRNSAARAISSAVTAPALEQRAEKSRQFALPD